MSRVRSEIANLAKLPGAAVTKAKKLGKAKPMLQSAVRPLLTGKVEDWRSEYAYSVGLQAFIYGFPYIYNAQVRHKWVTQPRNPKFVPYAAVNEFWHAVAADGRHLPRRRLPEQRHALLDRLAGPRSGADHPLAPRHGRALLHLRADGRRLRQHRLHRPADDRLEGRELRDRRTRLRGRASRRRRSVARALAEPDGAGHGPHPGRQRPRRRGRGQEAPGAVPAHPAERMGQGEPQPRRASRRPRCRSSPSRIRSVRSRP